MKYQNDDKDENGAEIKHIPSGREKYASMVHIWNRWHTDYLDVTFPRAMIRYEDLLYRQEDTTRKICDCIGGTWMTEEGEFKIYDEDVKKGRNVSGLAASLEKYVGERALRTKTKSFISPSSLRSLCAPRVLLELLYASSLRSPLFAQRAVIFRIANSLFVNNRYSSQKRRFELFNAIDLTYAKSKLSSKLLRMFNYDKF